MDRVVLQQQLLVQTDADKRGLFSSKDAWKSRLVTLYNDRITLHKGLLLLRQGEGIVLYLKGFEGLSNGCGEWEAAAATACNARVVAEYVIIQSSYFVAEEATRVGTCR